jgi:hypothetical protein
MNVTSIELNDAICVLHAPKPVDFLCVETLTYFR